MNPKKTVDAKNTADFYYFQLTDILNRSDTDTVKRLLEVYEIFKELLSDLTEDSGQFFPNDFAQLVFILETHSFPSRLEREVKQFYLLVKHKLLKKQKTDFGENNLKECVRLIAEFVSGITEIQLPEAIAEIKINKGTSLFSRFEKNVFDDRIVSLKCIVRSVDKAKRIIILNSVNDDEIFKYHPEGTWKDIIEQVFPEIMVNFIDVIIKDAKVIAREGSFVVLEPDYLMDATEIAEAFEFNGFNCYSLFIKRLSRKSVSSALILGTVVNTIFDNLLNNPLADFDEIYYRALKDKILAMFTVAKKDKQTKITIKNSAKEQYKTLQKLVNNLNLERYAIEPTFISPKYGFQGRLDLLSEFNDDNLRKDIYELKSGKPADSNQLFKKDGTMVKTGVYVNHLAQITIYNLLLDTCYPKRKGVSAVIYSRDPQKTVRNVPNYKKIKQMVVIARNSYIAFEYKFLRNEVSFFTDAWDAKIESAAFWIKEDFEQFKELISQANSLARDYYTTMLRFVLNELKAMKLGSKRLSDGFASLWVEDLTEKKQNRGILTGLKIIEKKSDFKNLHLTFSFRSDENSNLAFRPGDICVLYPADVNSEYSPSRGRLIKCIVKDIRAEEIVISIRNKMYYLDFAKSSTEWVLDFDSTDSLQKSIIHSLSNFLFASKDKQNLLLGIKQPAYIEKKYKLPDYLSDEQKLILKDILAAEDYFLLQGPPGTGKTRYMLSALVETLITQTDEKILVLAYTNRAIDEICSAIKKLDCISTDSFDIIRLGRADTTGHKDIVLSNLVESTDINKLFSAMKQTRIYVATVATAVTYPELLDFVDFDIAIVDEASQVTEANLVGLLSKIQRFVLIGDERQLPAISLQQNTLKVTTNANLVQIHLSDANKSLFQRLLECAKSNNWQKSYALLSAQARMHRDIMLFPGEYFYNRSLKIFDEADQTAENDKFKKSEKFFAEQLATHRFSFINTPIEKHSKYNSTEADTVVKIIETITDEFDEINENTIGVISPFRMQCATIMKKLPENLADRIAVDTVEKFQGSQRDFIIISMAVNFPYLISKIKSETIVDGQTVDRKLNVAITRARSHVIILGNAALLSESFIYAKLIDFCKSRGAYFDLDEIQSMTKNS